MPNRHFTATAVALAAGIALVPGLADAAGTAPTSATTATHPTDTSLLLKDMSSQFKTFTSPAHALIRHTAPATTRGADSDPSLELNLTAQQSSAYSVALSTSLTSDTNLKVTADFNWGDGTTDSKALTSPGFVDAPHTYAKLGTYTITVTLTDAQGDSATNWVTFKTAGSDYTPYGPTRLLDTRNGTGAPVAKVRPGESAKVQVGGNGGIPADVTAVVLNVTVTDTTAAGYITAYDDGDIRPDTSNLNYTAHSTVANQVIVQPGADGAVDLYNGGSGSVDLIADIAGYFTTNPSSGYTPLAPQRLVDTRNGTGTAKQQLAAGSSLVAQVAGADSNLPAAGITAVALNITATGGRSAGYLTAYPDGTTTPVASNVNFTTGQTVANAVITPVGTDGRIRIYNGGAQPVSVIVDVVGYYSPTSKNAYTPFTPDRFIDTRSTTSKTPPLAGNSYTYVPISPTLHMYTTWVLNATVTDTTSTGYLTVDPDPNTWTQYQNHTAKKPTKPTASTLNWLPSQTTENLVQADDGASGIIDFWNTSTSKTDLIVDLFGTYDNS